MDNGAAGEQHNHEPFIPERIGRLRDLADNLWWSWHEDGRQVFRSLDYALWRSTGHNPVKQLRIVEPKRLLAAAADPAFLELYDSVMIQFDSDLAGNSSWFNSERRGSLPGPVAYFSPEFAIHGSLPMYAGGLGILAGDICKEASDLGLPLMGVGFMYPQGYFRQQVSADGWQQEEYRELDFLEAPINPCPWPKACGPLVSVELGAKKLYVTTWLVQVGRVNLYLLDTNLAENAPEDRTLSARLYTANPDERLRQLIVLGICGVRVLRELGITPSIWHSNEDHTSFMMLERLREEVSKGRSFEQAKETVRSNTVFTTHTPVAAGQNILVEQQMESYLRGFVDDIGISMQDFFGLGHYSGLEPGRFSLSALALRLSGQCNAVSRLHGRVTRAMWHGLWPQRSEDDVPIMYVTNGVHLPTWRAPEVTEMCGSRGAETSGESAAGPNVCLSVADIPDDEFWKTHLLMKTRLIRLLQDRAQQRWVQGTVSTQQVLAMGTLLDPYALTIAFSRRFTEYKRPGLILSDSERLKRIVNSVERPVQIIFAGKSHPADNSGKALLRQVYMLASDRQFQGRVAFVEDYDMHLSREMVRGVDVWLNVPRRLQEACGTSGMKAAMNGVLNVSVPDGWWAEGYNGINGWSVGGRDPMNREEEDRSDAESLYSLLENQVVPLYYERDRMGIPHGWIKAAKESIMSISGAFSASRMVKEYADQMYIPAARAIAAGQRTG